MAVGGYCLASSHVGKASTTGRGVVIGKQNVQEYSRWHVIDGFGRSTTIEAASFQAPIYEEVFRVHVSIPSLRAMESEARARSPREA